MVWMVDGGCLIERIEIDILGKQSIERWDGLWQFFGPWLAKNLNVTVCGKGRLACLGLVLSHVVTQVWSNSKKSQAI